MTWNHRVIRSEDDGEAHYAIHECFYDNKADTIPTSWTENAVEVCSETRSGLLWVLAVMAEAVSRPILEVQGGKLVEVEPVVNSSDDLTRAIKNNKEFAEGME